MLSIRKRYQDHLVEAISRSALLTGGPLRISAYIPREQLLPGGVKAHARGASAKMLILLNSRGLQGCQMARLIKRERT